MQLSKALSVLALLSCTVGCGLTDAQKKEVRNFSQAAEALAELTAEEYPRLRQSLMDVNKGLVRSVGTKKAKLGPPEKVVGQLVLDFDGPVDPDDTLAAVQAAEALAGYAAALAAVVDYDSDADLKKAADKLAGAIKGVKDKQGEQIATDAQADALGAIVRTIGGWFVEYKKKQAVKEIFAKYKAFVPKLVAVLRDDLNPNTSRGIANELRNRAALLSTGSKMNLDKLQAPTQIAERALFIREHATAIRVLKQVGSVLAGASSAFNKVEKANNKLDDVLQKEMSVKEIDELYKQVKDVVDNAKVLLGSDS